MTDDWGRRITNQVAARVKELRGRRTVQWLEDRTVELGHRVSRSTISELETGQRKSVTLADSLALAAALETSLFDLAYPGDGDTEVEILPGVVVPKSDALEDFGGSRELNSRLLTALSATTNAASSLVAEVEDLRRQIDRLRRKEGDLPVLEVIVERESVRTDDGR